jgi:LacI family transcriptional regulator
MSDVATESGLSRATVSLVLRDSPQIPELTKQRVREAMERLGYIYDHRAAAMRTRRTMTVGVVVTNVRNPYFAELSMALEGVLHEQGFALLQGYSHDDQEREDRLLAEMVEHRVDGVFLVPSKETASPHLSKRLGPTGTPLVLITRRVVDHAADYVGIDNILGGQLLAEHLAGEGCRRIAFLGGPAQSTARAERERGLALGLRHHGLALEPALAVPTSADRQGGIAAVEALLARGGSPDAIVCYSDVVAFGVVSGLWAAGLEPGRDVALASFDDIAEAQLQHPPLTSVATYPELVGAEAARLLLERLETPDAAPRRVVLEPSLSVRASSTTHDRRSTDPAEGRP